MYGAFWYMTMSKSINVWLLAEMEISKDGFEVILKNLTIFTSVMELLDFTIMWERGKRKRLFECSLDELDI